LGQQKRWHHPFDCKTNHFGHTAHGHFLVLILCHFGQKSAFFKQIAVRKLRKLSTCSLRHLTDKRCFFLGQFFYFDIIFYKAPQIGPEKQVKKLTLVLNLAPSRAPIIKLTVTVTML
jgi:hypothetical protein